MIVAIKKRLLDARTSRIMAHRADAMMGSFENGERYRKICDNAWRESNEAEAAIAGRLQTLSAMDRMIVEQWVDGATFEEIAKAAGWSVSWTNRRFNAAVRKMQEEADRET